MYSLATVTMPMAESHNKFDGGNRLTQVIDTQGGTINRSYDNLDRLLSETTSQGTVSYAYDAADRRISMTVTGQPAVNYVYDVGNRLTNLSNGSQSAAFTYDADNRRDTLTLPNGVTVSYGYDNAGQLISLNYAKGGTSLGNLSYGYDNAGQRVQLGGSLARTTLPGTVSATSYNAANQLTDWNGATLSYDANGNMTSDGTNTYTWDSRQRLKTLTGTVSGSFNYDAANRRNQKMIAGQTTGYVFDGINLVQELTGTVTPTVQANLLAGDLDEMFSRTEAGGSTYSYIADALRSTLTLSDSTGSSTTEYTYGPYGQTASSGSASTNSQQYTARENDGAGVYYYRARYYLPNFARFISGDPIGLAGGINTYTYVEGAPINNTDPLGLMCSDFDRFTSLIEQNRADGALTLGSLLTAEAIGTMPKTPNEMRALGVPRSEINPLTSQLSRWSSRFQTRALRVIGRTPTIVVASTIATASVVAEGFYDWGVIGRAAWETTSAGDCNCEK